MPKHSMRAGQLFSGFHHFLLQSFPSPRLVVISRLKGQSSALFPHSWWENRWVHTFSKALILM